MRLTVDVGAVLVVKVYLEKKGVAGVVVVGGQVLVLTTVLGIGVLLWVNEKVDAVFLATTLVSNCVNGIIDVVVIVEIVELVYVVIKVEDCVDFVNDTELLEVDICGCVGGVGL